VETRCLDLHLEVLGDLVLVDYPPDPQPDLSLSAQASAAHRLLYFVQLPLGRCDEILTLTSSTLLQFRVAAGNQTLIGIFRRAEGKKISLVEQPKLQASLSLELLDRA